MTTKVEIDAHAGWPVKVTQIDNGGTDKETLSVSIVAPNTIGTFYVWDGRSIVVQEDKKPEVER